MQSSTRMEGYCLAKQLRSRISIMCTSEAFIYAPVQSFIFFIDKYFALHFSKRFPHYKQAKRTPPASYWQRRKDLEAFRKLLINFLGICEPADDNAISTNAAGLTPKEKSILRYHYYIHNGFDISHISPLSQRI